MPLLYGDGAAFRPAHTDDRRIIDLGMYIPAGRLEVTLQGFDPRSNLNARFAHFIAMSSEPWLNHHSLDASDSTWALHCVDVSPDRSQLKMWAGNDRACDAQHTAGQTWDGTRTYRFVVRWDEKGRVDLRVGGKQIVAAAVPSNGDWRPLRYIALGSDLTVAISNINSKGPGQNRYPALLGVTYSDLRVYGRGATAASPVIIPPQWIRPKLHSFLVRQGTLGTWDVADRCAWSRRSPIWVGPVRRSLALMRFQRLTWPGQDAVLHLWPRNWPGYQSEAPVGKVFQLLGALSWDVTTTWATFERHAFTRVGDIGPVRLDQWLDVPLHDLDPSQRTIDLMLVGRGRESDAMFDGRDGTHGVWLSQE